MFQLPDPSTVYYIEGYYSVPLVIISIAIAFSASYTALFINNQLQQSNGFFHRRVWLILASLAMGLGIWSMHFIGMRAFKMPISMSHNTVLTIVSAIPAILASYFAFALANGKKKKLSTHIIASIFMGAGISTMHYLGMAAMEFKASYVYEPVFFSLSILIAIVASFASLFIFTYGSKFAHNFLVKLAAAALMAAAVYSMHYMGMFAIKFYTTNVANLDMHTHTTNFTPTVLIIAIGITSLFFITFLTSRLDHYVNNRLKNFDPLTSLPNQNQFMEDQKIEKRSTFVSIIHINNFEKFISAYGYTYGDEILLTVQQHVINMMPKEAKIYRTEPNRFTIVMPLGMNENKYRIALEQICVILGNPIVVGERLLTVDMVCAVSSSAEPELIHNHLANVIAVFQQSSTQFTHKVIDYNSKIHTFNFENKLVGDLKEAMEQHHLYIVYQPKMNPEDETVVGLEALIRWNHPEYGFISPAKFIPVLESSNKILQLTDWIIEEVCKQIQAWNEENIQYGQVAINIPGSYITSANLMNVLDDCLFKYNVSARQIELELTETSVIHDIQNAIKAVRQFREKGLHVALDDFGTGLSSLSYLKEIPITTIKIDKSFVDGVPISSKDSAILKAIVELSYSLDLCVVIEGVETAEQVAYLRELAHIPIIQGYYYSKPLTPQEFSEWFVKQQKSLIFV